MRTCHEMTRYELLEDMQLLDMRGAAIPEAERFPS
jgi:hypothetical protein